MQFRPFEERLADFCKLKKYRLIYDDRDYTILEDEQGERIFCSGYALHLAMLEAGVE